MKTYRALLKIISLALLLFFTGCKTTSTETPDWVKNPQTRYSESQFLVSIGEGDTRHSAENAADANLARIFKSQIKSNERLIQKTQESTTSFYQQSDLTSDINVLSDQTLINIQHAEAWVSPNGRVFAIAYLNRRKTAEIYRTEIEENCQKIALFQKQLKTEQDTTVQYALLRSATKYATQNKHLLQQLKIIYPPATTQLSLNYSETKLQQQLMQTAQKIRVKINISGDENNRITNLLEELITRYGFVIGTPETFNITGNISLHETEQKTESLVFVRYALLLKFQKTDGTVLISINKKGREAHTSFPEARIRAFRTLENTIRPDGTQRLDDYFDRLSTAMLNNKKNIR